VQKSQENRTINELRNTLWDTLEGVKEKRISARDANAITSAANAIIKGVKLELEYSSLAPTHPAIGLIVEATETRA